MNGTPGAGETFSQMMNGIVSFLRMPYDSRGSAVNWFLFIGLIIVIIGLWNIVLRDIVRD